MLDLAEIAASLDRDEKFCVTYRFPVSSAKGKVDYETRQDNLLDVAEDSGLLYVRHEGQVIWIKTDEVVSVQKREA